MNKYTLSYWYWKPYGAQPPVVEAIFDSLDGLIVYIEDNYPEAEILEKALRSGPNYFQVKNMHRILIVDVDVSD